MLRSFIVDSASGRVLVERKAHSPSQRAAKTNDKERFIQTALREWAHARAYHHSHQSTANYLDGFMPTIGTAMAVSATRHQQGPLVR